MAKNGNGKEIGRILGLLEDLPIIKKDVSEIKSQMAGLCEREKSTQLELTDYKDNNPVAKQLDKHEQGHDKWFGWLLAIAGIGSPILTAIIMFLWKKITGG